MKDVRMTHGTHTLSPIACSKSECLNCVVQDLACVAGFVDPLRQHAVLHVTAIVKLYNWHGCPKPLAQSPSSTILNARWLEFGASEIGPANPQFERADPYQLQEAFACETRAGSRSCEITLKCGSPNLN